MSTQPDVIPKELEDLDFAPMCDAADALFRMGVPVLVIPCQRAAVFGGRYPCCGVVVLSCREHLNGKPWHCCFCHDDVPSCRMSWTPL